MVANAAVLVVGEIITELLLVALLPVAVVPIKPLAAAAMTRTISSCNPNDLRIASSTSSTSTSTSPLLLPPPSDSWTILVRRCVESTATKHMARYWRRILMFLLRTSSIVTDHHVLLPQVFDLTSPYLMSAAPHPISLLPFLAGWTLHCACTASTSRRLILTTAAAGYPSLRTDSSSSASGGGGCYRWREEVTHGNFRCHASSTFIHAHRLGRLIIVVLLTLLLMLIRARR